MAYRKLIDLNKYEGNTTALHGKGDFGIGMKHEHKSVVLISIYFHQCVQIDKFLQSYTVLKVIINVETKKKWN
jgi:hypothetical protein